MSTNCYGRIPRERMFEQNERLTTKHIKTLTFLQDIGQENKELKQKLKVLEVSQCITGMQIANFCVWRTEKDGSFWRKRAAYFLNQLWCKVDLHKKSNIFRSRAGCWVLIVLALIVQGILKPWVPEFKMITMVLKSYIKKNCCVQCSLLPGLHQFKDTNIR